MSENKDLEIIPQNRPPVKLDGDVFISTSSFEGAQRMGMVLYKSRMIPDIFKNNMADCVIVLDMAARMKVNPVNLMQNIHEIHGKFGFSGQFIIGLLNNSGRFSPLTFRFNEKRTSCRACAIRLFDKEAVESPTITIEMAKAEGWYNKKGSKWQTMPELMLMYRSATFFGRLYAPDLLMGMRTDDELHDIHEEKESDSEARKELIDSGCTVVVESEEEKQPVRESTGRRRPAQVEECKAKIISISSVPELEVFLDELYANFAELLPRVEDRDEVVTAAKQHLLNLKDSNTVTKAVEPDKSGQVEETELKKVPNLGMDDPAIAKELKDIDSKNSTYTLNRWKNVHFDHEQSRVKRDYTPDQVAAITEYLQVRLSKLKEVEEEQQDGGGDLPDNNNKMTCPEYGVMTLLDCLGCDKAGECVHECRASKQKF